MKNKKQSEEQIFLWIMRIVTFSIIFVFASILVVIVQKGWHALSWEMISQEPKGGFYFGKGGGIIGRDCWLAVSCFWRYVPGRTHWPARGLGNECTLDAK